MTAQTWRFEPLDTLFFREARPHGSAGGTELSSLFPPPARTVAGAVRTVIGESQNVNWTDFAASPEHPLRRQIGYGDDLGALRFKGPWIAKDGKRLYPAPLFLLANHSNPGRTLVRLRIGRPVECDLGNVALAELPPGNAGAKPLEFVWLSAAAFADVLKGNAPKPEYLVLQDDLFADEPRLGIARIHEQRTVEDGMLYQTRHIRPKGSLAFEFDVTGAGNTIQLKAALTRFGGEGRLAAVHVTGAADTLPPAPAAHGETRGLILTLLTPALFGADRWLLPEFREETRDGVRVWRGTISGVALTLHTAVIGKARREGGWGMAERKPRPVRSLIPAGGAYYCTVDSGNIAEAVSRLHGQQVGNDTALGHGLIACGLWNRNEYQFEEK